MFEPALNCIELAARFPEMPGCCHSCHDDHDDLGWELLDGQLVETKEKFVACCSRYNWLKTHGKGYLVI